MKEERNRGRSYTLAATKTRRPGLSIPRVGKGRMGSGGRGAKGGGKEARKKERLVCSFILCVDVVLFLVPNAAVPPYFKRERKRKEVEK